jgi:apolipoprotein N-acyltransferase
LTSTGPTPGPPARDRTSSEHHTAEQDRTSARRAGLLAAVAGLIVALSLPPWGWWPLSFVGVAVFEVALGRTPGRRRRAALGFTFAFVWLIVATMWMWQLTAPGYVVANAVFGGYHALAALVAPTGRWRLVGRPLAHTLVEAVRLSFPFGGVPLATLGIAQAGGPFLGIAAVGGVVALTWFVFQLGFALGGVATSGALSRRVVPADLQVGLVGAAVAAVMMGATLVAPSGHGTGQVVELALVQGGGEQGTSADDVPSALVTERHLAATAAIPAAGSSDGPAPDIVVWPENVVDVGTFDGSEELALIAAQAQRLGVPILVGVTEDVAGRPEHFTNAEVVVAPSGEVTDRYDKVRRVPFGEYVPLRVVLETLGAPVDQIGRDALAGTEPAVLDIPLADDSTVRAGVVISWEVFFGGRVREGVREGGGFIVNPTNGASYTGTIVQTQQIASSRLRAVETGRWVAQAAPTGFSAFISPSGEVIERTAVGERAVIHGAVEIRTGSTWYTELGDGPIILTLLAALLAILAAPHLRGRKSGRLRITSR